MPVFTDGFGGDVSTYVDTFLNAEDADINYGANSRIYLYYNGGVLRDGLIKFTLDLIPDGSTVNSATLYLYEAADGVGPYAASIHRIMAANSAWTEAGATWNHTDGVNHWAGDAGSDGGVDAGCCISGTDYVAGAIGTLVGDGDNAAGTEYAIALDTTQVELMLVNDYGLVFIPPDPTSVQAVYSSDVGVDAWKPKLVIDYTENVGGDSVVQYRRPVMGIGIRGANI